MSESNSNTEARDVEAQPTESAPQTTKRDLVRPFLAFLAVSSIIWAIVMTVLYVKARDQNSDQAPAQAEATSDLVGPDTVLRSSGALGIAAISHVNVVVNDSVIEGAAYYEMLGFRPAYNADGLMTYLGIRNHGFCVDAGFDACHVDIVFLKHETIGMYLELFFYYEPEGDRKIPIFETNDAGGIRHIAVEVEDAVETYEELKSKDHQGQFITKDTPIPLDPFPYTFFYWIDKYGVQWEFEQGRPVEYYSVAGITG